MLKLDEENRSSRRSFIRNAAAGVAGAAVGLSSANRVLGAIKDSGEVTLDGLLITYFSAPLGTDGSASYTFLTPYSTTLGFRSLAAPDLTLIASVSDGDQRINPRSAVAQAESRKVDNAIKLFPRPEEETSFTSITPSPGLPQNTVFYGLFKPVLGFTGNGRKAEFRFVDAEASFTFLANSGARSFLSEDTAASMIRQYVSDPAALTPPRFIPALTSSGDISVTQVAERGAPRDIISVAAAKIIEQTGFTSEVLKQAFAVGTNLEITYYSAQESKGRILKLETDLKGASRVTRVFWDRVFKTFVIV